MLLPWPEASISERERANSRPKEKLLVCKKCHTVVPESRARDHIRKCWGMPIGDNDPMPEEVPKQYL